MGALHVFNLAKTLVLVPHKKQKCQVTKAKYQKVGGQAAKDQKRRWGGGQNRGGLIVKAFFL